MIALGCVLLPNGVVAHAGGGTAPGDPSPGRLRSGEVGSGLPSLPVVVPTTARRSASIKWSDLGPSDAWAKPAINFVGDAHSWMRDFAANADGSYPFRPDMLETRKYLARTAVKAFAPHAAVDPSITFPDLDPTQSFYKWANIAVQKGWIRRATDGRFLPDKPVTMITVHRVLVLALGMRGTAHRLDGLRTRGGIRFDTPMNFGTTMLGMRLGLRFPSAEADHDVTPRTQMQRAQVAYSLYKAKTLATWVIPWLRDQYDRIELPNMGRTRRAIVQWGIRYVGYPYVWGGEWGFDGPVPAALGGQSIPGFDCSGLAWWDLRADDGGAWDISPPRPYEGWPLPQRTSADMAHFGDRRWKDLEPGDLAFYDGNGDGTVDHVDVYVGNGYALDSSTSVGGVTLMYIADGWYHEHFVHGRRILPK
jgi:cell wall-associated NlpC family hydrolase